MASVGADCREICIGSYEAPLEKGRRWTDGPDPVKGIVMWNDSLAFLALRPCHQNFLPRDDSDNWIHWDFNVNAGDVDVYFTGIQRDIHMMVGEFLTDEDWKELILAIKHDYGLVGRAKSDALRRLEKYVVFQNKYVSLANLCADLHAEIVDAPGYEPAPVSWPAYEEGVEPFA